jgi:hypothetical protein
VSAVSSAYVAARAGSFDRLLAVGSLAVFGICTAFSAWTWAGILGTPAFDWQFYAAAVERWLAGEPIYPGGAISTLGTEPGTSYAYPPASVPLMLPFAPWPVGAVLWVALLVGVLLAAIWAVAHAGWPSRPLAAFAAAVIGLAIFPPIQQGLAVANVNVLTTGMLGLVWAVGRRTAPAIGLLTVLKVFPFSLSAPLGPRAMVTSALVAGVVVLVTLPLVGVSSWTDYVSALRSAEMLCGDPRWFNPSLGCLVEPVLGSDVARWAGLIVGGALLLVALRAGRTVVGMSAAALAVIAPATEIHAHYFGLLYMLFLIALASWARSRDA